MYLLQYILRNTKLWPEIQLGEEDITRDIPNVNEEALKNLDRSGIVYIGAEVKLWGYSWQSYS